MTPLLEVENLSVTYRSSRGDIHAVRGVSLALDAGKTIGIAGESGSGKSTIASAVLRLHPKGAQVTGRVSVAGNDVNALSWGALRRMRWADAAMVFQGAMHSLNPIDGIGRQVAEPVLVHAPTTTKAAADARVAELLEMVGLTAEHAYTYPHQLSGGQKQRVMIAMALACNPKLLIADEPTTALDVKVQAQIMRVLASLSAELGLGLMLISHDLSVLASVCDEVLVMYGGRIVEQGPGARIFEHPRHPYTQALAAAFPTIGDPASRYRPQGVSNGAASGIDPAAEQAFVARCRHADGKCLVHRPEFARFAGSRDIDCLRADDLGISRLEAEAAR
ncbi:MULTISPECIES: ABC transporter ATP-binding protein [unclassified Mycolicibacterium]|uniref:ABC transporter ATP-binding protein n=1 Tax=unclassified Mycolicibacterium TaxID=2636767 RepID=UPI0012DBDE01|nr:MULTISPECIES: ABC transporter ATP-binding protein [unclassified Mycolicibacterium]MUL83085.1 ABC transporter ATP-binding protein [Mycolicibacterium sp. CBMA 329]MUL89420.1 ABC transporter ATP-binding protein [Mycolicibacterium sp. CBMA 331]MUL99109.1 ABC transporter ATP-binding protein [Mycolicibacterium sp. CBMA 334]MUM24735.1 ABC transporter ATP-binding protein [Mycolicibacterium sp. CBMA 295]MUM38936.1 ABC transporter ATP-binding protein [Mycolicibacterium sp. CBMA 247]